MADVAALGFSVDASPIVTATEALENLNTEVQKTPSAVSRLSTASDALVAALNRNVAATASLTQRLDALDLSGAKTATTINNITNVTQKATDNVVQFTGATNKAKSELDATAAAADKMAAAWSRLGAAGAAVSKMQTPQGLAEFRLSSLSSTGAPDVDPATLQRMAEEQAKRQRATDTWARLGPAGDAVNRSLTPEALAQSRLSSLSSDGAVPTRGGGTPAANGRLNAYQAQNLFYQGTDVVASLASGMPLTTIALQQGGQIAPTFMGPGGASISGVIGQVTEGIGSLVGRIGLMTGASAAAAAAVAALIVAQQSYASSQLALAKQLAGTGRLSGLSASDVNAIAAQGGGGLSRGERRDYAGQLAATGLSGGIIPGVLGSLKDFSATMGQDESSSLQTLAAAFKDPAKGAEELNKQLGLLDGTALENIQRLTAQGDKLGAQRALLDALSGSLAKHTDLMTGWGRVSEAVLVPIANLWDRIGEGIDKALGGGDLAAQIAKAKEVLDNSKARESYLPFGIGAADTAKAQAVFDDLTRRQAQVTQQQQRAQQNVASAGLEAALKSINPSSEALKALEDKATAIRRPFMENWVDPFGAAKSALEGLATQTKQMKEDMAAGGAQYADAVRSAQFGLKTVGYAPDALNVAQVNKTQDDKRLDAFRNAATDTDTGKLDKALASIEEERKLLLQTAQQRSYQGTGSYSTNIRDVPEQYRDQVYNAATRAGIDPNLLSSVFYQESRFRPEIIDGRVRSKAGATGPFQFMPDTSSGLGINPLDFDQAANGAAGMLARSLRSRNGNVALALADYNYGSGNVNSRLKDGRAFPEETRNYIDQITRGRPTEQSNIQEQQQRNRQLEQEKATLDALKASGGENTAQYRAQAEVVQRLTEAQNKNQLISKSLTQQFEAEAKARQEIQSATQYQGFLANDNFSRDQLGRSREDQAAASSARSYQGTSYYDQVYNRTKETNNLTEAKQMVTDGATSFVTALRRGASASDALASAFGSAADKLLSKVVDSLVSSAFGGISGGGGGGIASLFGGGGFDPFKGFATGGYTGSGGQYEPAGVVHRGEVVWSQSDVARYGGAAVVERMRLGYPGYADGGVVGGGAMTGGNSYMHAPISVVMQGSSGDAQKDQAHVDNAVVAFREEARSIFAQEQAKSLQTNGTLWKAGVRRAAS